jgi:hypothetical protein
MLYFQKQIADPPLPLPLELLYLQYPSSVSFWVVFMPQKLAEIVQKLDF